MRNAAHRTGQALGQVVAEQRRLEERAAAAEHAHRVYKARRRTRKSR